MGAHFAPIIAPRRSRGDSPGLYFGVGLGSGLFLRVDDVTAWRLFGGLRRSAPEQISGRREAPRPLVGSAQNCAALCAKLIASLAQSDN